MSNISLTQIPAQFTFEFHIIITPMLFNPSIIMSIDEFINEII